MDADDTPQSLSDVIQAHLAQLQNLIDEHGWAVHAVEGTSQGRPQFAHTVGFQDAFDHPEVVVYGLPERLSGRILNGLGELIRQGNAPRVETRTPDVISNYDVVFIPVTDPAADDDLIILGAMWEGRQNRAVQLVWPDSDGHFPWNPECDPATAQNQPVRGSAPLL